MKKYTKHMLIAFGLLGVGCLARCATGLPTASATVKVVDDESRPVKGAKVMIGFSIPYNAWSTRKIKYTENHEGLSDKRGLFSASDGCKGDLAYVAKKEGYYDSASTRYDYKGLNALKTAWQPENPELIAVLKKIINPVPMYVRHITLKIPELNKAVGFDMEKGDWVLPYGKGINSDFIFHAERRINTGEDFDVVIKINFSNSLDGVQKQHLGDVSGSTLTSPQLAFLENYDQELRLEKSAGGGRRKGWETDKKINYIYRVRSHIDKEGRLVSANYGKICGGITKGGELAEKLWLDFTYYYNSNPQSRSLEFDPNRNLAKEQRYKYAP
jgi:hypothetical protein